MKKLLCFGIVAMLLGCGTPYMKSGIMGGYSDYPVGSNKYVVTFEGNAYTSSSTANGYAFRRAHDLCMEHGYYDFRLAGPSGSDERVSVSAQWNNGSGYVHTAVRPNTMLTIECINPVLPGGSPGVAKE